MWRSSPQASRGRTSRGLVAPQVYQGIKAGSAVAYIGCVSLSELLQIGRIASPMIEPVKIDTAAPSPPMKAVHATRMHATALKHQRTQNGPDGSPTTRCLTIIGELCLSRLHDECCLPLSQPEVTQAGMVIGTPAEWPQELSVATLDWQIVDARVAVRHQTCLVELPVLVAVAAKPLT